MSKVYVIRTKSHYIMNDVVLDQDLKPERIARQLLVLLENRFGQGPDQVDEAWDALNGACGWDITDADYASEGPCVWVLTKNYKGKIEAEMLSLTLSEKKRKVRVK